MALPARKPSKPLAKKRPAAKRVSPAERERVEVLFSRFESLEDHPKTEIGRASCRERV